MKQFMIIFLISIIFFGCNSSKSINMDTTANTLTQKEISEGWQLLFNGQNAEGWHTYGKEKAGNKWAVADGALVLETGNALFSEGGDLVTDGEYGNYHFKLDWKISEKGNSGIIFYIHEDVKKYHSTYNTGLEMQVLDNGTPIRAGHNDAKLFTHRAGDLYDMIASEEAVNPQGEWNHAEIKCVNGKLDFYMNGKHTLSTQLWDDHWRQMVANSKFKDMPGFGIFKTGKISLQDHGDKVWYRNIKIRKL